MQAGFYHFMRSLSTKVTKTYDIDITLIWMQLHAILLNFVRICTVRNCKYLIFTILSFLSHLLAAGCGFLKCDGWTHSVIEEFKFASVHPTVNNLH